MSKDHLTALVERYPIQALIAVLAVALVALLMMGVALSNVLAVAGVGLGLIGLHGFATGLILPRRPTAPF